MIPSLYAQRRPNVSQLEVTENYASGIKFINSATYEQETGADCASISCPAGYECQVQAVQCFAAPCPGIASCAKISDGGYPASTDAVDQPLITTVAAPEPGTTKYTRLSADGKNMPGKG